MAEAMRNCANGGLAQMGSWGMPGLVCDRARTPANSDPRLPADRQVDRLLGEHGIQENSA